MSLASFLGLGKAKPAPVPTPALTTKQLIVNDITALPDTLAAAITFYSLGAGTETLMVSRGLDATNLALMYEDAGKTIIGKAAR